MTTPKSFSELSSFYVEFTEGTYSLLANGDCNCWYGIFNPFMFWSFIVSQAVEKLNKRWTISGTYFLVKFLNYVSSVLFKDVKVEVQNE